MSELLNCPFCGSESAPHVTDSACECCIDFTVVCNARNGGCGASGRFEETKELAVSAWNRRPQITVTKNESGQIVAVTRTDAEGKILEVIAESAPQAQLTDGDVEMVARQILNLSEYQGLPVWVKPFAKAIAARCGDEQLRQQRDELRDLAEKYLHAREKEAGTRFSLEVATDNFTNSKPERDKHFQATIAASKAEKELYQAIERIKP